MLVDAFGLDRRKSEVGGEADVKTGAPILTDDDEDVIETAY
jgi:hypothetical protein